VIEAGCLGHDGILETVGRYHNSATITSLTFREFWTLRIHAFRLLNATYASNVSSLYNSNALTPYYLFITITYSYVCYSKAIIIFYSSSSLSVEPPTWNYIREVVLTVA
jgi:hypothetical protein